MATPTPTVPAPLLDLDTYTPPNVVVIDGMRYTLRRPGDLTLRQSKLLEAVQPRLDALCLQEALSEDEDAECRRLASAACAIVLEAPADVQARLNDSQRLMVILAFSGLLQLLRGALTGATNARVPEDARPTGASSFPDSAASMAAPSAAG